MRLNNNCNSRNPTDLGNLQNVYHTDSERSAGGNSIAASSPYGTFSTRKDRWVASRLLKSQARALSTAKQAAGALGTLVVISAVLYCW